MPNYGIMLSSEIHFAFPRTKFESVPTTLSLEEKFRIILSPEIYSAFKATKSVSSLSLGENKA